MNIRWLNRIVFLIFIIMNVIMGWLSNFWLSWTAVGFVAGVWACTEINYKMGILHD